MNFSLSFMQTNKNVNKYYKDFVLAFTHSISFLQLLQLYDFQWLITGDTFHNMRLLQMKIFIYMYIHNNALYFLCNTNSQWNCNLQYWLNTLLLNSKTVTETKWSLCTNMTEITFVPIQLNCEINTSHKAV